MWYLQSDLINLAKDSNFLLCDNYNAMQYIIRKKATSYPMVGSQPFYGTKENRFLSYDRFTSVDYIIRKKATSFL